MKLTVQEYITNRPFQENLLQYDSLYGEVDVVDKAIKEI